MAQYQDVFKRYEKKYMLCPEQYALLSRKLQERTRQDEYGEYTICNLYYDTGTYDLIRSSIEKPVYKEKMRLRSYGVPKSDSPVYLELKKKYKGIVYKRRVSLPLWEAEAYLSAGKRPAQESQILHELDWFINRNQPFPRVFIAYDRSALYGKEEPELRVTFDRKIRWRKNLLDLTKGDQGSLLLNDSSVLMEIKIPGVMPLWMTRMLTELSIFPVSFSKYGECYQRHLADEIMTTGGIICA